MAHFLGVDGGFCLQELTPFAIVGSVIIALLVAYIGWARARKLAREQAAVRLIFDTERLYRADFNSLWFMLRKGVNLPELGQHLPGGTAGKTWEDDKDFDALPIKDQQWMIVARCLNYYEGIAISIKRKAVDSKTMRDFIGPKLVKFVMALHPFIIEVRKHPVAGSPDTWLPLEKLAKKWGADFSAPSSLQSKSPTSQT